VPSGRAVVALTGGTAVTVPGVTLDMVLPAIHSELVHGSAKALARLAMARGVLGVSADRKIRPTGYGLPQTGGSAFAWQGLGNEAARPGAGAGVHVALIDTGVTDNDYLNRASGHLVDAIDTSGLVGDDGTGDPTTEIQTSGTFTDGYGHGTFMASLIAGGGSIKGNRTLGVAPGATVDVVKVADASGTSSFSSMMVGLNWVATNAATEDVANLSFGLDPSDVGGYGQDPLNLAAETLRYLGTNVVVSSGNTAGAVTDPGFDPWVITVGAANTLGWYPKVAPFSGSGVIAGVAKPDLLAAGVNLLGELPPDSAVVAANPAALQSNGFYRGSGSSEATAIVSGLAALFVADNPGVTTAQVKAALRVAANPIYAQGSGAGLANVAKRLARPRDDWRMGGAGASGEGNFDSSSWDVNAFGAAILGSDWDSNKWGSNKWGSNKWGSAAWDALAFDSNKWGSNKWGSNKWGSNKWGSNKWGSNKWGSNKWGADAWGSESWGTDGGEGA
jgi:serine protease AprX